LHETTHHHGEAHHDDHHHQETFITKYIFSQDHKMIAKQFLITGIIWAFIGGLFSVIFRLQLADPNATYPFLEDLLGHWAKGGKLQPEFYYALVTMHGTILVFFVLTAGLSGTFANFLIPLQIGARDMASPMLNMLSYWFFFLASVIMMSSLFVQTGPASGGWTIYPPLSALGEASSGSKIGMDLWLVSMAMFIVSSLLGGLNYITTILNQRTKGMSMTRMPLTIWALFFTAVLGVLSFPVLLSGAILLLFDRNLGTSFYLSDIVVAGKILPNEGGSAILFQHLFWFLGHPEVYVLLLPAIACVAEIIPANTRRPLWGYKSMVYGVIVLGFLSFIVWAHHMYLTGMGPKISTWFQITTVLISVP
jgi:cytochrome c oxidase subunit 1